jgi:hypothetical protein
MTAPWLPICVALSATSAVCYVLMGRVQARKGNLASRRRASGGDSGSSGDGSWTDFGLAGSDSSGSCDAGDGGGDVGGD